MARRGRKRAITESSPSKPKPKPTPQEHQAPSTADQHFQQQQRELNNREVERRVAAIQAIQLEEAERLLTQLRFLRSYFSKEQLETTALQFFQENLPNLSLTRNEKYRVYELKWKDIEGDGRDMYTSVNASGMDTVGGVQLSLNPAMKNILEAADLRIPDFVLDEPSESQMPGTSDAFQTPGVTGNRLSFGMTPKTLRLPKNGEVLLSVRGSPLGVYREDNLEAIHESGDGVRDDAS